MQIFHTYLFVSNNAHQFLFGCNNILTKFCIEITFFEYILLIWLISIQIERIKKFAAMANKPRQEKIKLLLVCFLFRLVRKLEVHLSMFVF